MIDLQSVTSESHLREAFGCFPSGVTAVCALVDGVPRGMAASSFTSVSLAPPLVSLCIQRTSSTWPLLRDRPRLGLSVLAEGQDDACRRLSAPRRRPLPGRRVGGRARPQRLHQRGECVAGMCPARGGPGR